MNDKPKLPGWMVLHQIFYIWNGRKFLYFPPSPVPTLTPSIRPPPRHHTLTRVSKISCRKPESLSTQYCFKPLVKSPCMTDTLVCVGSQLRHSDFLTPHSDHVLQKTWWNLVNSQFSLIQGRRIFRAKQKIRTTDFHTYWSGLFEKPLMITERILGYESWYNI